MNASAPLPAFPQRIGIVTSLQAAALRDVLITLSRRAAHIGIVLYPTPVQGEGAAAQIADAIRSANERHECDVLIVCRGGGSLEDLWAFNDEALARTIRASAIPLISGVGHETDFTIADFAADQRAPTPHRSRRACRTGTLCPDGTPCRLSARPAPTGIARHRSTQSAPRRADTSSATPGAES